MKRFKKKYSSTSATCVKKIIKVLIQRSSAKRLKKLKMISTITKKRPPTYLCPVQRLFSVQNQL